MLDRLLTIRNVCCQVLGAIVISGSTFLGLAPVPLRASDAGCDGRVEGNIWPINQEVSFKKPKPVLPSSILFVLQRRFGQGTFKTLIENVDSFKRLGIKTLQLTPFLPQSTDKVFTKNLETYPNDHGYWTSVSHLGRAGPDGVNLVDPKLGTFAELKTLKNKLAEAGIEIVLDVVMNHVGPQYRFDEMLLGRLPFNKKVLPIDRTNPELFFQLGGLEEWEWGRLDLDPHLVEYGRGRYLNGLANGMIDVGSDISVRLDRDAIDLMCTRELCDLPTINHSVSNPITHALLKTYKILIRELEPVAVRFDAAKHIYASDMAYFIREMAAASKKPITFLPEYLYSDPHQLPVMAARLAIVRSPLPENIRVRPYDFSTVPAIRQFLMHPGHEEVGYNRLHWTLVMRESLKLKGPMIIEDHDLAPPLLKVMGAQRYAMLYEMVFAVSEDAPMVFQTATAVGDVKSRDAVAGLDEKHVVFDVVRRLNALRVKHEDFFAAKRNFGRTKVPYFIHWTFERDNKRIHFICNASFDSQYRFMLGHPSSAKLLYESPTIANNDPHQFSFNAGIGKPLLDPSSYTLRPGSSAFILEE